MGGRVCGEENINFKVLLHESVSGIPKVLRKLIYLHFTLKDIKYNDSVTKKKEIFAFYKIFQNKWGEIL